MSRNSKKHDQADMTAQLTEDLQRIQADFINFKKRSEEEQVRAVNLGKSSAVSELFPVLDNLDRALASQPEDIANHAWVKGVGGVSKQLRDVLASMGLQRIETVGFEFNPELMDAVSADGDGDTEVVAEELQAGYTFNGEVLRPAMVKISRI